MGAQGRLRRAKRTGSDERIGGGPVAGGRRRVGRRALRRAPQVHQPNEAVVCGCPNPDVFGVVGGSGTWGNDRRAGWSRIRRTGSSARRIRRQQRVIDIAGSVVTEGNNAFAIWTGANADITVRNGGSVARAERPATRSR